MLTKAELTRRVRRHAMHEIYDESGCGPLMFAVYSLVDPRELRQIRYIGQTSSPRRRLLQHLNAARLWLPEQRPWWLAQPKLRPLYDWIRGLHFRENRLPTMIVHEWTMTTAAARLAERARIFHSLQEGTPIYNVEREILGGQSLLL
jgi:hypothetical protein